MNLANEKKMYNRKSSALYTKGTTILSTSSHKQKVVHVLFLKLRFDLYERVNKKAYVKKNEEKRH